MVEQVEQVIYARDTRYDPVFQYYSIPTSCVGGGATMPQARASYHAALADILGVDEAHLPTIIEHVEVPTKDEIWVRTVLDKRGGKERDRAYRMLQAMLPRLDKVTLDELHSAVAATGAPVIVLVLPDDPMSLILDQMSAYDALWMAFPNDGGVAWTALYKPLADGVQPAEETVLDAKQVRDMTVRTFVEDFIKPSTDGFDIEISPFGTRRTPKSSRAKQLVIG
jgi:hypothetical protein